MPAPTRIDATGNPINTAGSPPSRITPSGEPINYEDLERKTGPKFEAPRTTFQEIHKNTMNLLPIILGTLGGIAGNVPGAAGGAMLGSAIRNIGNDPKEAAKDILGEGAIQGATEGAAPFISKGFSRVATKLNEGLIGHFATREFEDAAAAEAIGVPMSVGQATQSPAPRFLERVLAPRAEKTALANEQQRVLGDFENQLRVKFSGSQNRSVSPAEHFGAQAQDAIKTNYRDLESEVGRQYNRVKFDAKVNTIDIPVQTGSKPSGVLDSSGKPIMVPVYENREVQGPIHYDEAASFIQKIKPAIDRKYANMVDGDPAKAQFSSFKRTLDDLSSGIGGNHVIDWDVIKQFRTDVNRTAGSQLDPTQVEGGLRKLSEILGRDIEKSVAGWESKSPGALGRLKSANAAHQLSETTFPDRVKSATMAPFGQSPDASAVFDKALTTPEATREMINALGTSQQRSIRGFFFEHALSKAEGNPDAALSLLDNPQYRKVFTSPERADMVNFFRATRRVKPDESTFGSVSVALKGAGIGLAMGKGIVDFMKGENQDSMISGIPDSALEGASVIFATRKFAQKVLLNPNYARVAARLATMPPDSGEAFFLRKTILTTMRGTQAVIELANGNSYEGTVDQSGKIKVSSLSQSGLQSGKK